MADIDTPVMGTPFYTYHRGKEIWLGVFIAPLMGVFAVDFDEIDWCQWLREELKRSHAAEIPQAFLEMK